MASLAGLELAGRPLKVGPVIDGTTSAANASTSQGGQAASANWKLDDDDGITGMQLNAQSRVSLMAKLGQTAGLVVPAAPIPVLAPAAVPPIIGVPSMYLMIQNMFVLEEQHEKDWELDLRYALAWLNLCLWCLFHLFFVLYCYAGRT